MGYPKPQDKIRRPKFMTTDVKESLPVCNSCKIINTCYLYKTTMFTARVSDKQSGSDREVKDTKQNFGCNWHSDHTDV
jgi:hypothetical protein